MNPLITAVALCSLLTGVSSGQTLNEKLTATHRTLLTVLVLPAETHLLHFATQSVCNVLIPCGAVRSSVKS